MDRIGELGKEDICSICQKKKLIIAAYDKKLFCENCFNDKYLKKHHMKNVNENAGLDKNDNYIHRRMQDQEYRKKEVPASAGLDKNDNYIHRREQNQPKQKKSRKKK